MDINPVVDTIMNIEVFLFIALMVWLYVRKEPSESQKDDSES
ncbi:MAG: hypothetical protein AAF458_05715 [Pseudomonadota bacterium]